jgi:hypothetical protein
MRGGGHSPLPGLSAQAKSPLTILRRNCFDKQIVLFTEAGSIFESRIILKQVLLESVKRKVII